MCRSWLAEAAVQWLARARFWSGNAYRSILVSLLVGPVICIGDARKTKQSPFKTQNEGGSDNGHFHSVAKDLRLGS